jgi:hypothetical protein
LPVRIISLINDGATIISISFIVETKDEVVETTGNYPLELWFGFQKTKFGLKLETGRVCPPPALLYLPP